MGIGVPLLGFVLHRPILFNEAGTLWLMLIGIWMRANAETFYYILFARRRDNAIWLGDLLSLLSSVVCNFVLVPQLGLIGVGVSSIVVGMFLFLWRGLHVWREFTTDNADDGCHERREAPK